MRTKLTIFFVLLASALVVLAVTSSTSAAQVHLQLNEFQKELTHDQNSSLLKRNITLYGKVKEGSIEREGVKARFRIIDGKNEMVVEHSGKTLLPDTFQDGAEAGVEGYFDKNRSIFVSHKVMAKCASRYDAASTQLKT
ncbi:MAG TPA: cytochrome c maturation protein CcmE, partial [Turneriella sp.]|nr:cytochrome c maturation protein CcmE [Turneriella sp.]